MSKTLTCIFVILIAISKAHALSVLENANVLLSHLYHQNTRYQHGEQIVLWPGETASGQAISFSDCSGFVNALLRRSYELSDQDLFSWLGSTRPLAKDYYLTILNQNGFKRQRLITDVLPGDILAVKYFDGSENTGHVMVASGAAVKMLNSPPLIENTLQWRIEVIDSSRSGHGILDSRFDPDTQMFRTGAGKGYLRIYTSLTGEVIGYSWSESERSAFQSPALRHLVVGRIERN